MKLCKNCGIKKGDDKFHFRAASVDGLAAKCKSCQSEYDKARANNPDRVEARKEYAKTEAGIEAQKRGRKKWVANNKGKIYEITKSYRQRNPNKHKAHGKISYAIKCGQIKKMPCEVCGGKENLHAHHDDYSYALTIRWLCATHHKQWHRDNGEGLNPF